MKKIILGTAQFNGKYGVSNKNKDFNFIEIKKIVNYSIKNNIRSIDTALSYFSDPKIYELIKTKFSICTKIPSLGKIKDNQIKLYLKNYVINLKKVYSKQKIDSLIFHNPDDFKIKNKKKIRAAIKYLNQLKKNNQIRSIGASIYTMKDFYNVLEYFKNYKLDLIQVPISILNNEFNNIHFIKIISSKKIKVQARSIFLQGLLLMEKKERPKYFDKWINEFEEWDNLNKLQKIKISYNYVSKLKFINNIVVGFFNYDELKFFFKSVKSKNIMTKKIYFNNIRDSKLTNPNLWEIK